MNRAVERIGVPAQLVELAPLLECPACRCDLEVEDDHLRCTGCAGLYPVRDGVVQLARLGAAETWSGAEPVTSLEYQERYEPVGRAEGYNRAYEERLGKRWSTRREAVLLRRLLGGQGRCGILLDLPSGGGRLSPTLEPFANLLVEADIAPGQLHYAQTRSRLERQPVWMTASAFHIPFKAKSVDGTVCCRLCHHLPTHAERTRLVSELLRVSSRFAVMSFFDYHSLKNVLRRLRRPMDRKPPKLTMTVAEVRSLAREHEAELVECPALSFLSSGHRYALMVKTGSGRAGGSGESRWVTGQSSSCSATWGESTTSPTSQDPGKPEP